MTATAARKQALTAAVRDLGARLASGDLPLDGYCAALCALFQSHFGCARASLWRFVNAEGERRLRCMGLQTATEGHSRPGGELAEADYRVYFEELLARGTYASNDVMADPALAELHAYFQATGVTALLDTAFQINGEAFGVVCLEEVGVARTWTRPEQSALREAAALVSLTIARMGPTCLTQFGGLAATDSEPGED
jgi:GAF domain-containing protein